MRCKRCEHKHKRLQNLSRFHLAFHHLIHKDHHLCDCCIEAQPLDVFTDFLHRRMIDSLQFRRQRDGFDIGVEPALIINVQPPDSAEEAEYTFDTTRTPGLHLFQRTHEHFEQPHCVGAVLLHHVIGVHHIAERFGHLLEILTENNPLMPQLHERFPCAHVAEIVQHLMPEPRVH